MKRFFVPALIFIALLLLTSCTPKDSTTSSNHTVSSSVNQENSSSASDEISSAAPIKAVVSVDYASEELLSQKDTLNEFVDATSEYTVTAVFTANTPVREFKYVELSYKEADSLSSDMSFHVDKVLYSANELSPEKPLVVTMELDSTIPNRGISYVDENGVERYFTISMSGKDESLLLSEFSYSI